MPKKPGCYALYKGDKFLALGTMEEIAKQRGVLIGAIQRVNSPSVAKKRKNPEEGMILIKVED